MMLLCAGICKTVSYAQEGIGNDVIISWEDMDGEYLDVSLAGYTLGMEGAFQLYFYVNCPAQIANDASTYMRFCIAGEEQISSMLSKSQLGDDLYQCKFVCRIDAPELTEDVHGILYCKGQRSVTWHYSVRNYANTILQNVDGEKSYEVARNLILAILDYGTYAQKYFSYDLGNLANAGVYSEGKISPVEDSSVKVELDERRYEKKIVCADTIQYYGASLVCNSSLSMKLYFVVPDNSSVADYSVSVDEITSADKSYRISSDELNCKVEGGMLVIELNGITAERLMNRYVFELIEKSTGVKAAAVTYSPMNYVMDGLNQPDENLQKLVKALYLYAESAIQYEQNRIAMSERSSFELTKEAYDTALKDCTRYPTDWENVLCIGDSVTMGVQGGPDQGAWPNCYPKELETLLGVKVINAGVGGATIWSGQSDNHLLINLKKYENVKVDAVFCMAGLNDWFYGTNCPIGNENIGGTFTYDVNRLFSYFKEQYRNADVYIVIPMEPLQHYGIEPYYDFEIFRDIIRNYAQKYGFTVIDLAKMNVMNAKDSRVKTAYYSDGIHPNTAGYQVLGTIIAGKAVNMKYNVREDKK